MTALLAGIDFSSKAVHAALIPLDEDDHDTPPVTLRVFEFASYKSGATTPAFRSVERCRSVRNAVQELLSDIRVYGQLDTSLGRGLPTAILGKRIETHEVAHVCVEEPFGASRKADNVMRELYGAILASIPPHIERDTITTHEWRRIIWPNCVYVEDMKAHAVGGARFRSGVVMNEHEAEAYLIARAARTRLHNAIEARTT